MIWDNECGLIHVKYYVILLHSKFENSCYSSEFQMRYLEVKLLRI